MIDWLIDLDKQLFIFLNSFHNEFWDNLMVWITGKKSWYPLYGLIISFVFIKFKKERWFIFITIALLISTTEWITSGVAKPFFERLRPCNEPSLSGVIHHITGCGKRFSFFSAHASNTFALATLLFLMLKTIKLKWIGILLIIWSIIISYSRVYVGVHYPLDIVGGMLCGWLLGIAYYKLYQFSIDKLLHKS